MNIFGFVVLPLLIFGARVLDVSMGTLRVIFIARGNKVLAPLLGFFEVAIWLLAIQQIMNNLSNVVAYIAYPAGFAMGTFVGMLLEEKLISSKVMLRVIVRKNPREVICELDEEGFPHTIVSGEGAQGPVEILFMVINREEVNHVLKIIKGHNPKAFYSIEDVKFARDHYNYKKKSKFPRFMFYRKGK